MGSRVDSAAPGSTVEAAAVVRNRNGLHARPSSVLAETALRYEGTSIRIRRGELEVDAKSIMELLLLEANCGSSLTIVADGPGARAAVKELLALFEREFDVKL